MRGTVTREIRVSTVESEDMENRRRDVEKKGITKKLTKPTPFCSQMVVVKKKRRYASALLNSTSFC